MQKIRGVGIIVIMLLLLALTYQNHKELTLHKQELKTIKEQQDKLLQENVNLTNQVKSFLDKWNVDILEVTAYAPFDNKSGICNDGNPRVTSTGTRPGPGTVAVNPSVIPYGSRIWIQGYGWGKALDTGGAIRQRDDLIDVFMWTHEEAIRWGRQKAVVVYERNR